MLRAHTHHHNALNEYIKRLIIPDPACLIHHTIMLKGFESFSSFKHRPPVARCEALQGQQVTYFAQQLGCPISVSGTRTFGLFPFSTTSTTVVREVLRSEAPRTRKQAERNAARQTKPPRHRCVSWEARTTPHTPKLQHSSKDSDHLSALDYRDSLS